MAITYSFKTYLNTKCIFSEKNIYQNINNNKNEIIIKYSLINEEKKTNFKITEKISNKLVSKNRFIGKIKFDRFFDVELLGIPLMVELFDVLISIDAPGVDKYDLMISGYIDLDKLFDEETVRGSISKNEGYVTSQGSPEIYTSVISSNFKAKKNFELPIAWGKETKFFPDDRTKNFLFESKYFLLKPRENKEFYGVSNIEYIVIDKNLLNETSVYIEHNSDPFDDGSGIALYNFEEIKNGKIIDHGRYGYDLKIHGNINLNSEDGIFNKYLDYKNKTEKDYLRTGIKINRFNIKEITISFWINVYEHTNEWLSILRISPNDRNISYGSNQPLILLNKNNNKKFYIKNDSKNTNYGISSSSGQITYNNWHFITIEIYDKKIELYIDGNLTDTYTSPYEFDFNDGYLYVGDKWYKKHYKIDQLRIFLRKLTTEEIKQIMKEKINLEIYKPDLSWLNAIFKNNIIIEKLSEEKIFKLLKTESNAIYYNYKEIYNFLRQYVSDIKLFDCTNVKYIILYKINDVYKYKTIYY